MKLRRFKVIKEYPGSPKIGDIFIKDFSFGVNRYVAENKSGRVEQNSTIENFPEYFEELEPVDSKIESEGKINYIDVKQTTWERAYLPKNKYSIENIENLMKTRELWDNVTEYESIGYIESMSLEDNAGEATEEVYDYNGKMVWNNKDGLLNEES